MPVMEVAMFRNFKIGRSKSFIVRKANCCDGHRNSASMDNIAQIQMDVDNVDSGGTEESTAKFFNVVMQLKQSPKFQSEENVSENSKHNSIRKQGSRILRPKTVVNVDEVLPRRCNYKVINHHPNRREELYSANSLRCKSLEVQPVSDINRLIEETNAECVNIEVEEEEEEVVVGAAAVVALEDEKKVARVLERANTVPTFDLSKNDMSQRSGGSLRDLDERNSALNIHRSEDMLTMGSTAYEDSVIGDSVVEEGKETSDDEFEDVFDNSTFEENYYDQMFKRQMVRLPRIKYNRQLLRTKNLGKSLDSVVPSDKKDVLLRDKRYSLGYYSEHRKALNDDCIRSYEVFTDLQTIDEHHSQEAKSKENFAGKFFDRFKKGFAKSSENLTADAEKGLMGTIKKKWGSARKVQEDDSPVWYCHQFVDMNQQDNNMNLLQVKHGEVRPVSTTFEETVEEIPKIPTKYSVDISNDVIYWSMQTRYDCCDEEESPMESYQLPSNSLKSERIRQTTTINQDYVVTRKYNNIHKITILGKPQKINKDDVVEISDGFVRLHLTNGQEKILLKGFHVLHEDKADGRKEIILTNGENKEVRLFQKSTGKLAEKKLTLLQKFLGRRMTKDELELKGIYQNETIFGNTLVKLYETSQRPVPEFINRIIDLIEMPKNIVSDGIYRTSGNIATIQKIRIKVDSNNIQILNEYKEDAEVLAGALKLFFRELKESIISEAHYFKFKDILNSNESDEDKYKATAEVIKTMHVAHKETLRVLMEHLLKVSEHRHTNNMSLESMSICWGQSIICFSDNANTNSEMAVQAATDKNKVVLLVLNTFKDSYASDVVHSESTSSFKSMKSLHHFDISRHHSMLSKTISTPCLSTGDVITEVYQIIEGKNNIEGVYETKGNKKKVDKIMKKATKEGSKTLSLLLYGPNTTVHDLADFVKIFVQKEKNANLHVEFLTRLNEEQLDRDEIFEYIDRQTCSNTLTQLFVHLNKVLDKSNDRTTALYNVTKNWLWVLCKSSMKAANFDKLRFAMEKLIGAYADQS